MTLSSSRSSRQNLKLADEITRHHLVVSVEDFDVRKLRAWLAARVQEVEADTWSEIGKRLGRVAYWEFEDYRT